MRTMMMQIYFLLLGIVVLCIIDSWRWNYSQCSSEFYVYKYMGLFFAVTYSLKHLIFITCQIQYDEAHNGSLASQDWRQTI